MKGMIFRMKTYKIPNLNKQFVKKFQYVYPDKVMVDNIEFYHSYCGLYIGEDRKGKTEDKEVKGYGNLRIIEVMQIGGERKRHSNLLFMYSKKYSTWDMKTLEYYLKCHKEVLTIPEKFKNEVEKVVKGLCLEEDDEFRSLYYEEKLEKFGYYNVRLDHVYTSNPGEIEEIPIADELDGFVLAGAKQIVRHPVKNAFDVKFQFPVTDDYIVCDGKVGTRIYSDVYEFFDNLQYREEYDENQLDVCKPWNPRCVEYGIYGLGKELWGHFASFAQSFNGYSIRYVTKNRNSEEFNYLKDSENLILLPKPNIDTKGKEKITEKCARTEEDIIAEYKEKGYTEVFEGMGFVGDWKVKFKKIFDFKCYPKEIVGKICMISDSDLVLINYSLEKTIQLNKQLLRYLRVELDDVGHTFIEETDKNEIALFGEQLVEHMKKAEDSSYF